MEAKFGEHLLDQSDDFFPLEPIANSDKIIWRELGEVRGRMVVRMR